MSNMIELVELAKAYAQAKTPQQALSTDDKAADLCGDDDALFEAYTQLASLYRAGWDIDDETAVALLNYGVFMDVAFDGWVTIQEIYEQEVYDSYVFAEC